MAYVTMTDIERRLGTEKFLGLTDDNGSGAPDSGLVGEVIDGAEGEVNSYLARQYRVPIENADHPELQSLLTSITLDLVEFRLHARRPPVPSTVFAQRNDAVHWLQRVANGDIYLPADKAVAETDIRGTVASADGEPRVFTRDELSGL